MNILCMHAVIITFINTVCIQYSTVSGGGRPEEEIKIDPYLLIVLPLPFFPKSTSNMKIPAAHR